MGKLTTRRTRAPRGDANPFHPELRRIARVLPRTVLTPLTVKLFRHVPTLPPAGRRRGVTVVPLELGLHVRVHRPPQGAPEVGPALLWIHGGGYVLGHAGMDDKLCQRFAHELGVTVVAVDYRLAPKHPYPIPLHDCYTALQWLTQESSIDPTRIAIAGASAGGGLAAALAQLALDRSEFPLAAQVLVYPMLDDRTGHQPDSASTVRRLWNSSSNRLGWQSYLGAADPRTAAPARRVDLGGLPPAWVGVGTLDILREEAVTYSHHLQADGVKCKLVLVPGAFHGFDAVAPRTSVAQAFFSSQIDFLRTVFESRPASPGTGL